MRKQNTIRQYKISVANAFIDDHVVIPQMITQMSTRPTIHHKITNLDTFKRFENLQMI